MSERSAASFARVRLVVDVQTGEVMQQLDYDAWGRVIQDTNPGFQPFGLAGGLYDPETGLVRFGARDYDPEIGRWTAKDPIRFEGGDTNIYAYCGGDPVNCVDSSGEIALSTIATAIGVGLLGAGLFAVLDCIEKCGERKADSACPSADIVGGCGQCASLVGLASSFGDTIEQAVGSISTLAEDAGFPDDGSSDGPTPFGPPLQTLPPASTP